MTDFKVGDKVKCIRGIFGSDTPRAGIFGSDAPRAGEVYTVVSTRPEPDLSDTLLGIKVDGGPSLGEWYASRFVLEESKAEKLYVAKVGFANGLSKDWTYPLTLADLNKEIGSAGYETLEVYELKPVGFKTKMTLVVDET